jgi:hypothetical protein
MTNPLDKMTWPALDTLPIHPFDLDPPEWWACAHPERPPDDHCQWDLRCKKCLLHMQAAQSTNTTVEALSTEGSFTVPATIPEALDIARNWHEKHHD